MNAKEKTPADTPLPRLAPRPADSHKGNYGRAVLVGGSRGMSGAIALAGMAALRGGAGLVQLAVPDVCQDTVAGIEPSYMTAALPSDAEGRISATARARLEELTAPATAVACGPGLGRSDELNELVAWFYGHVAVPAVLDADALNALAEDPGQLAAAPAPRILTPHPAEFARLVGSDTRRVLEQREVLAVELAERSGAIVVVKGHRTFITDGERTITNSTGNPGMATGGTGDVLTGVIVALLCQGLAPFDAARLGVYLHGLAGDLAAAELGEVSMMASDLVRFLPAAFVQVTRGEEIA